MQIRSPTWLLALLFAGAPAAFAQAVSPPPPWPVFKEEPVDLAADPVRPLLMGALRITLDNTSLANARLAIGAGVSQRQGSGTEALDWLCYTIPDASAPQRMWLTASELSRGRIDGVIASDLAPGAAATAQCPDLPAKFRPVRFDDGLWLGALSADLRRAIGIPAKTGTRFASLFHGQSGNLQMVSSTMIEFRGPRAITLHVAHSSQN
ncbi:MAG: hypothetical protein ABJD97_10300 [Betaproteobacteria bacterium]